MIRTFLFSIVALLMFGGTNAATPWWDQDTVCRLNPSTCYAAMGAGYFYDSEEPDPLMWDVTSGCWGKKYICVQALKNSDSDEPVALGRSEIADTTRVSSDFDTTILNGDCFGVRKTTSDGTQAYVNSQRVNVWCDAAIAGLDIDPEYLEEIPNGTIVLGTPPSCSDLAAEGFVGIKNGKCYGKSYSPSNYYIQCSGDNATLIVLNGATDWDDNSDSEYITNTQANNYFQTLVTAAQNARAANNIVLNNN